MSKTLKVGVRWIITPHQTEVVCNQVMMPNLMQCVDKI